MHEFALTYKKNVASTCMYNIVIARPCIIIIIITLKWCVVILIHSSIIMKRFRTNAFTEYWGWAWLSDNSSSASEVSTLLVCMVLHQQITRRHCIVTPTDNLKDQSTTIQLPSSVSLSIHSISTIQYYCIVVDRCSARGGMQLVSRAPPSYSNIYVCNVWLSQL